MRSKGDIEPERDPEAFWPRGDGIDELLGSDPTPTLSGDAVRRIHDRLARENDGALDALLGLDEVSMPTGLADRILVRVAAERGAQRRRRRMRILPPTAAAVALVAAAVIAVVSPRGGDGPGPGPQSDADSMVADGGALDGPSDEFLAALPALEDLVFLTEELDPLEADALFLMDAEDALVLDFLEMGG